MTRYLRDREQDVQHPFGRLPAGVGSAPRPVQVAVPLKDIDRMRQLAELSPVKDLSTFETLSEDAPNDQFGVNTAWLKQALATLSSADAFDWPKIQGEINEVPHFLSIIPATPDREETTVHFAGLFSQKANAVAVVNIHGWPGCFLEFMPAMKLLMTKYSPTDLPFHFLVPSLPGYTFTSGPPLHTDFNTGDAAAIFKSWLGQLDIQYIVQGGDIGSRVARALAVTDDRCLGIHLNFCYDFNETMASAASRESLSEADQARVSRIDDFLANGVGYGKMHATRGGTISLVLGSSPVALLAWLGEKYETWVAPGNRLSMKEVLTFVTIYWITDSFARSIYPYRGDFSPTDRIPAHGNPKWNIPEGKPFGFSNNALEILPIPRRWAEKTGKLTWYRENQDIGHFMALERPDVWLNDVEDFVVHALQKGS